MSSARLASSEHRSSGLHHTQKKSGTGARVGNHSTRDGDRKIRGTHWPARLARSVSAGVREETLSLKLMERTIEEDITLYSGL